ncbi:MAG: hypothetical protein NZ558_11010 [Blastocatellia bacterium]|nr:hypothetical protein [Blastocatellia bacterium]
MNWKFLAWIAVCLLLLVYFIIKGWWGSLGFRWLLGALAVAAPVAYLMMQDAALCMHMAEGEGQQLNLVVRARYVDPQVSWIEIEHGGSCVRLDKYVSAEEAKRWSPGTCVEVWHDAVTGQYVTIESFSRFLSQFWILVLVGNGIVLLLVVLGWCFRHWRVGVSEGRAEWLEDPGGAGCARRAAGTSGVF